MDLYLEFFGADLVLDLLDCEQVLDFILNVVLVEGRKKLCHHIIDLGVVLEKLLFDFLALALLVFLTYVSVVKLLSLVT